MESRTVICPSCSAPLALVRPSPEEAPSKLVCLGCGSTARVGDTMIETLRIEASSLALAA